MPWTFTATPHLRIPGWLTVAKYTSEVNSGKVKEERKFQSLERMFGMTEKT